MPIGSKEAKAGSTEPTIFRTYSLGVSTNRDEVAYDFDPHRLAKKVERFIDDYNAEVSRWIKKGRPADVDNFVNYHYVKWSRDLKLKLQREQTFDFVRTAIRKAIYRPFTQMALYCAEGIVDRLGPADDFFPLTKGERENKGIWLKVGAEVPMYALAVNLVPNLLTQGGSQCFPLYTYSEDERKPRDNITPKGLTLFQIFYDDNGITREDIFHYVYSLLNHPAYRTRYAENLKRELPRIPFVGVAVSQGWMRARQSAAGKYARNLAPAPAGGHSAGFFPLSAVQKMQGDAKPDHDPKASARLFHLLAAAGKKLADLHVNYESAKEFPLVRQENKEAKLDWRVEALRLSKDKTSLFYNEFLTLNGIPPEVYDYRLGNRSGLDWVIDQYRVTRDEKGNIASDPNRPDDDQYIVRLIGQVVTVSLDTLKVVAGLPPVAI